MTDLLHVVCFYLFVEIKLWPLIDAYWCSVSLFVNLCANAVRKAEVCYLVLNLWLMYITVVHAHIMIPVYLCTGTCVITLAHTYFYLTFWCVIVDSITLPSAVDSSRSKDCVVSVMSLMAAAGGIRQIWKLQVFAYFYYGGLSVKKWNFIWEGDPWYEF